jgi:hypothetical protein
LNFLIWQFTWTREVDKFKLSTISKKLKKNINLEKPAKFYRVIHERGISEFLFAATHYTHCNNILISNFENNYN